MDGPVDVDVPTYDKDRARLLRDRFNILAGDTHDLMDNSGAGSGIHDMILLWRLAELGNRWLGLVEAWEIMTGRTWTGMPPYTGLLADESFTLPEGVVYRCVRPKRGMFHHRSGCKFGRDYLKARGRVTRREIVENGFQLCPQCEPSISRADVGLG